MDKPPGAHMRPFNGGKFFSSMALPSGLPYKLSWPGSFWRSKSDRNLLPSCEEGFVLLSVIYYAVPFVHHTLPTTIEDILTQRMYVLNIPILNSDSEGVS